MSPTGWVKSEINYEPSFLLATSMGAVHKMWSSIVVVLLLTISVRCMEEPLDLVPPDSVDLASNGRSLYFLAMMYRRWRQRWHEFHNPPPFYTPSTYPINGYFNCPSYSSCNPGNIMPQAVYFPPGGYIPIPIQQLSQQQQQQQQQHQQQQQSQGNSNVFIYQSDQNSNTGMGLLDAGPQRPPGVPPQVIPPVGPPLPLPIVHPPPHYLPTNYLPPVMLPPMGGSPASPSSYAHAMG